MNLPISLQNDETVVQLLRRHPISVIAEIVFAVLVVIVLSLILSFLRSSLSFLGGFLDILIGLVIVVGLVYALSSFYRYRNDVWLITTQRIVDSTKRTPFNHEVSSADLVNVQDISISKRGIFQTAFDYGDVRCQTASQTQVFSFLGVPKPSQVLELVDDTRDKARQRRQKETAA